MTSKLGILLLLAALTACSGDDDAKPDVAKEEAPPAVAKLKIDDLICPQVAILEQAQEVFDYGGEAADPAQLVAKARLQSIEGDCSYSKNGIDIRFSLKAAASRGPRLGGSQAGFPFFVAVVDPSEKILSRQLMTAKFEFSGSDKVTFDEENLHIFIPLPQSAFQAGPDYRVLVGLKLPKSQLKAD